MRTSSRPTHNASVGVGRSPGRAKEAHENVRLDCQVTFELANPASWDIVKREGRARPLTNYSWTGKLAPRTCHCWRSFHRWNLTMTGLGTTTPRIADVQEEEELVVCRRRMLVVIGQTGEQQRGSRRAAH
ncbi:hypothetical protein NDU88_009199 [Pleurodeles waltl]|uniref:Uncharacterized protein n=1 Tax=Pleurodeles waltl TaxID=8319 RepID=A0AAV7QQV3_PLEWA|nr:hypothetical protein NDU88_009199 [Pleurodeles waltl]